MAIFATLTLTARVEGRRLLGQPGRRFELAATLALLAAIAAVAFWQSRISLRFLVFPPLLLCVFRHRFGGFALATATITLVATTGVAADRGLLELAPGTHTATQTWTLQLFLLSVCLVGFPMAVELTERKVLAHRVAKSERDYRLLADYSSDLIGRIAADGRRLYISPSVRKILGYSAEEFSRPRWDPVHPDDRDAARHAFDAVLQTARTLPCCAGCCTRMAPIGGSSSDTAASKAGAPAIRRSWFTRAVT